MPGNISDGREFQQLNFVPRRFCWTIWEWENMGPYDYEDSGIKAESADLDFEE